MITPISRHKKLDFSEFRITEDFEIFKITETLKYDFTDNLDFGDKEGVYIFIKLVFNCDRKLDYSYKLLYCGKTIELSKRFDQHHRQEELTEIYPLYLAVCFCENEEEITDLENVMLNTFKFELEQQNNTGTNTDLIKEVNL